MNRSRLIKYAVVWVCVALLQSAAWAIDWTNPYVDSFDTGIAESDSYAHSLFWSKDMTPLPQPYLYYLDTDSSEGLVFVDYQGQPAELCYAFILPAGQMKRAVSATIEVEVFFPSNAYISQYWPGQLSYRTSLNGMTWSDSTQLSAGYQSIPVFCPEGTCYVRFSGTRAVIDYLRVSQYSPSATIRVPFNYPTIQAAIDKARSGDVIEVAQGTYSGGIDLGGKMITVRSEAGPQNTIINCPANGRGFYLHGTDSVIAGFTIQNGWLGTDVPPSLPPSKTGPTLSIGGGIYCESGYPTIANCIITSCTAGIGGGIGVAQAQPSIINCLITNCTAARGTGLGLLAQSNATITDCVFDSNKGTGASLGGGIYCQDSRIAVSGSRISNNSVGNATGGGVYCGGSTNAVLQNCLIFGNSATVGSGVDAEQYSIVYLINCTITQNGLTTIGIGKGVRSNGATVSVNSSIIWGNGGTPISGLGLGSSVNYSDVEGSYAGTSNLSQDPLFVSVSAGDYHLQSTRGHYQSGAWVNDFQMSPCIDKGDPSISAVVEPAPNGGCIDMGAYGASPQASKGASHTIYHVAVGGSDYNPGTSKDRPFKTIKNAVKMAQNGDTILIWPGTYILNTPNDEIVFGSKAITIQSAADPAIVSARIGYAFSFYTGEGSTSILSNLVIQGCGTGAIFCDGTSPTLRNLTVVGNPTGVYAVDNANPYITDCIFWSNSADIFQCISHYSLVSGKLGTASVADPLFADPLNSDYHLKSQYGRYSPLLGMWVNDPLGFNSPCIDKGDPAEDHRAEPKPDGNRIDIGAYGGTPYASRSNWPSY